MQKVRYEVDPYNRLIVNDSGAQGDLEKFRKVLDGRFRIGENNELSYHIKSPASEDESVPNQVRISGNWSLTDNHELQLTLDKEARETFGDAITLQGRILDVDKSSLLFSITTKTDDDVRTTYILDLQGSWKADEFNRLSFYVRRESGEHDILTFNGAWTINKDHQIVYQYEKASLVRKEKETHTLTFKGHWDIKNNARVSYVLDVNSRSAFDFEASIGVPGEDYIKFEVGIGLERRALPVRRDVILFGRWKLKRDAGVLFEIKYEDGEVHAITFGADARLTDKDTVEFKLKYSSDDKDTGMTLELSHNILEGDGEMFLRGLASKRELAVYAGMAWAW